MTEERTLTVKTVWHRSEQPNSAECICCEGKHVFAHSSTVLSSPVRPQPSMFDSTMDHVHQLLAGVPEGSTVDITFRVIP